MDTEKTSHSAEQDVWSRYTDAAKASANFVLTVLILFVAIFILVDWLPCWE